MFLYSSAYIDSNIGLGVKENVWKQFMTKFP